MLTASEIIDEAKQRAKVPGYAAQALRNLNAILSDLCQDHDFALARGTYQFNFNPSLSSMFGSGPYPLPLDYLRTSGSSGAEGVSKSVWYKYPAPTLALGYQVIDLVPVDLAEFDLYPQFAQSQSLPGTWATDMGGPLTQRIVLSTTGDMSGTNGTISNLGSTTGLTVGLSAAGEGVEPGSTILSIDTSISQVVLSASTTGAITGASVFFGIAPNAYVYPPPLGSYPVTVRYQRQMPPITNINNTIWFPGDGYLIDELASRLCEISDDERSIALSALAAKRLGKYTEKADDKTNRSQAVQLDARSFGGGTAYGNAKNTKYAGWAVAACAILPSLSMLLGGVAG